MTLLKDVLLEDLLPQVLREDPETLRVVRAIQPQLEENLRLRNGANIWEALSNLPSSLALLPDMRILDHMAFGFGVRPWDFSWTPERKARLLLGAIARKRRAGTAWAIRSIVAGLGHAVEVRPWFEDETGTMDPYTMDVIVAVNELEADFGAEEQRRVNAAILASKAARTYYTLILMPSAASTIGLYGAGRTMAYAKLHTEAVESETSHLLGIAPIGEDVDGTRYVFTESVEVTGTATPNSTITVNGQSVSVGGDGLWSTVLTLSAGQSHVITAQGGDGQIAQTSVYVWGGPDLMALGPMVQLQRGVGLFTTSTGNVVAGEADPVGRWEDQSGNGWHFTQPTSALRPIVDSGGVDVYGVRMESSLVMETPWSVYVSVRRRTDTPNAKYIYTRQSSAGYMRIHDTSSGGSAVHRYGEENYLVSFSGVQRRSKEAFELALNASGFHLQTRSMAWQTTGAPNGHTYPDPLAIGGDGTLGGADYTITNLVYFDRTLAESERALVLAWLEANND